MKVGYSSERLHHTIHPLFLILSREAEWFVGQDDGQAEWYMEDKDRYFGVRHKQEEHQIEKDIYAVKRFCFDYYREHEGQTLPWGIISGIRPSKLARLIWQKKPDLNLEDFCDTLWQGYRISQEKAVALWQVLQAENKYLFQNTEKVSEKPAAHLYIGIPFCPSRCYYCSFVAGVVKEGDEKLERYVNLLEKEIDYLKPLWQQRKIRSLYIGGGTPTVLSAELLERLLAKIRSELPLIDLEEFTVEAGRPDTITEEKLDVMKQYGVDRISINPQSFHDQTLRKIGRGHSVEQVIKAYHLAKKRGFTVNMDLIFGLKEEGMEEIRQSLSQVLELGPENVTIHTLTPKRGADLSGRDKEEISAISQEIGAMLRYAQEVLQASGRKPYYLYRQKNIYFENVGYALEGTECSYNIETMIEREPVIALGAGSISKNIIGKKITRFEMPKEWHAYEISLEEKLKSKLTFFA